MLYMNKHAPILSIFGQPENHVIGVPSLVKYGDTKRFA